MKGKRPERRERGFEPAGGLLREHIRIAGESRGFAVSRLLTHWAEVVGEEIAAMSRPVRIGYGKGSFGATLTLLTTGAQAPILQMRLPQIRDRVNACYGYNAISRVAITQTAPAGFAEAGAPFAHRDPAPATPAPEVVTRASAAAGGVTDPGLRAALEALGQNVLSRGASAGSPDRKG